MTTVTDGCLAASEAESPSPDDLAEQRDTAGQLVRVLEELPEHHQEVIRLRFQHGLRYREIAELTGLSVSNVGFRIHCGLQFLRKRLKTVEQR